jgi:hypothetical protein
MNIFHLSNDPYTSAKAMTNKHCVKMILESAQLMSTAHRVIDPESPFLDVLYKETHKNHPSAIWTRETSGNYLWLYEHFIALCKEYTSRYNKIHKTQRDLEIALGHFPAGITYAGQTPFRMAMPDLYKGEDPVMAYRRYYVKEKIKTDQDRERYTRVLREEVKQ